MTSSTKRTILPQTEIDLLARQLQAEHGQVRSDHIEGTIDTFEAARESFTTYAEHLDFRLTHVDVVQVAIEDLADLYGDNELQADVPITVRALTQHWRTAARHIATRDSTNPEMANHHALAAVKIHMGIELLLERIADIDTQAFEEALIHQAAFNDVRMFAEDWASARLKGLPQSLSAWYAENGSYAVNAIQRRDSNKSYDVKDNTRVQE